MNRLLMLALLIALGGCKRRQAPAMPEVWDDHGSSNLPLGDLAPPWTGSTRATLDNGLIVHWLHEPGSPVLRLRLLLPTFVARSAGHSEEALRVVAEAVRAAIDGRSRPHGAQVALEHGPGRFELLVSGREDRVEQVLAAIGEAFDPGPSTSNLTRARTRVHESLRAPTSDEVAVAALIAHLLGTPDTLELVSAARVSAVSTAELERARHDLLDPRGAVLVAHGGRAGSDVRLPLRNLARAWRGRGDRATPVQALTRIRPANAGEGPGARGRLLAEPRAPLLLVDQPGPRGTSSLYFGRVLPVTTLEEAGLARLGQRLLQEAVDARLVPFGTRSLFVVRVPVTDGDARAQVGRVLDLMSELARPQRPQRLLQAARLWLGARVVEASLHGEDWTRLWSEALDLATSDENVELALAEHAAAMTRARPELLSTWQQRWLDPRRGESGWSWVVAGSDRRAMQALARSLQTPG